MEEKNRVESIGQNLLKYVETKWNLMLLETSDKASTLISSIASVLLMTVSMIFVLLFLSVGAAIWIGRAYADSSMGFLIVGLFYLVVSIVLYAMRNTLIKIPVINKMLNSFHANNED